MEGEKERSGRGGRKGVEVEGVKECKGLGGKECKGREEGVKW